MQIYITIFQYKRLIDYKPLRIRFDKIDGCIDELVYDGTRFLVLFGSDSINSSIRNHLSVKSGITYVILHNCTKIKVDSYDSLPLEKQWLFKML